MDLFAAGIGKWHFVYRYELKCYKTDIHCPKRDGRWQKMEKLISRKEAAKILGISLPTLDAARNSGLISFVQYVENGCVYFTEAALQEYIARSTHRAGPKKDSTSTYRKRRP